MHINSDLSKCYYICDHANLMKVIKVQTALWLVKMIHPYGFGENPPMLSKIVMTKENLLLLGKRSYHGFFYCKEHFKTSVLLMLICVLSFVLEI